MASFSLAQTPSSGTLTGKPDAYSEDSDRAYVIGVNTDGSANVNEYLYFKVYPKGGPSGWKAGDWYSNPTLWLDNNTFHFSNAKLKMYNNSIQINKGGWLEFGSDQVKQEAAGRIGYSLWAPGLNIVGGNSVANSTQPADRKVVVFAEGGSIFTGPVCIPASTNTTMSFPKTLTNGADLSTYKLFIEGGILAKEVRVNTGNWADYVFESSYKLRPLADLERQIHQLGHLPGMPSTNDVVTNGFSVGDMTRLQQEKIEELTLYIISLKKEIDEVKKKLAGHLAEVRP